MNLRLPSLPKWGYVAHVSNGGTELLTTAQVSELTGLSVTHINRMALDGRLPIAQKLPGRTGAYLFDRAAIQAHLPQRTNAA